MPGHVQNGSDVHRRGFIAAAGALLASACLPSTDPVAAAGATARRWIDVHHHFAPPGYRGSTSGCTLPMAPPWSSRRSTGSWPAISMTWTAPARARQCCRYSCRRSWARPNHARAWPVRSTRAPRACARTIPAASAAWPHSRCPTSTRRWRRSPTRPTPSRQRASPSTQTRAIAGSATGSSTRCMKSSTGAVRSCSCIRFIFSHGGGTMPFLIERFLGNDADELVPGIRTGGQRGPWAVQPPAGGVLAHLRRMHYDTAQCANPVAMQALKTLLGASQVLFGTDYYYRGSLETASALAACRVFSGHELDAVGRGNALALWPALAAGA